MTSTSDVEAFDYISFSIYFETVLLDYTYRKIESFKHHRSRCDHLQFQRWMF